MTKIATLEAEIIKHKKLYAEGNPEISDAQYDALEAELRELKPDSPVLQVVEDTSSQIAFKKVKHLKPMLSLQKCYNNEEFDAWVKTLNTKPDQTYLVMHKLDGFAVELRYVYKNGAITLDMGVSRGDGAVGEDITENIQQIANIPRILPGIRDQGQYNNYSIRGEIVISKENFKAIKAQPDGERFKSARNLAAGTIHGKDPQLVKDRHLEFVAYALDLPTKTFYTKLAVLQEEGFKVVMHKLMALADIPLAWKDQSKERQNTEVFKYDADGIVIMPDNVALVEDLGLTGHHPRGSIAWKFDSEVVQTKLLDIEWQVSRTGLINPVAVLEPITTEGATISKATLHNLSEMKRLHIKIGAKVDLVRQGGVIPKILKCYADDVPFTHPRECPECQHPTKVITSEEGILTLHCSNENCPAVSYNKILHYIECMDMKGFGPAALEALMNKDYVKVITDLYRINENDIQSVGIGPKVAKNIIKAINDSSKNVRLGKFIFALGIPGVGKSTAESLSSHIGSANKLLNLKPSDIENLADAGEKTTSSILQYLSDKDTQNTIQTLINKHITFEKEETVEGKQIFVITGTLSIGRKEFSALIVKAGGAIADSISKKVNYLVAGEDCGSKIDKAKKLGIPILSEDEVRKLLKI
jgi:DNA ligase (NAD+)